MPTRSGQLARSEPLESRAYLAAGALDPTFGVEGTVTTGFTVPQASEAVNAFALTAGRVLAVGQVDNGNADVMIAARFLADGTLDSTFGVGGRLLSDVVGTPTDAVRLADGRFVVVGGVNEAVLVARFSADGALDRDFGEDGVVRIAGPGYPPQVAVAPDGKLIVAARWFSDAKVHVTRLSAGTGRIDAAFGKDGSVVTELRGVTGIVVRSDGRIVLGGAFRGGNGVDPDVGLVRLKMDGTPDGSFGTGGEVSRYVFHRGDGMLRLVSDGRNGFLVLGSSEVARFRANGTLDRTFGARGVAHLNIKAVDLVESPGASIVATGYGSFDGAKQRVAFEQLTATGQPTDPSANPMVETELPDYSDQVARIAIAEDQTVFAAVTGGGNLGVVKLRGDNTIDQQFGTAAVARVQATGDGDEEARALAVQTDGRYVVAGGSDGALALVRYLKDGALDPTFGDGGRVRAAGGSALSVRIVAGGKILVGLADGAARFNADGTLDQTYGIGGRVTVDGAFKLLADGRILAIQASGPDYPYELRRFGADGSRDMTFGQGGGLPITELSLSRPEQIIELPDGRLLVAGQAYRPGADENDLRVDWALWRLTADGRLDRTFGVGGKARLYVGGTLFDEPLALAVQADGKVVAAGVRYEDGASFTVGRWNADGTVDQSFGDGGSNATAFPAGYGDDFGQLPNAATAVVIQPDGRIIAAGYNLGPATNSDYGPAYFQDWGIARYNADGTLDHSFGDDGRRSISFGISDTAEAATITADGRLVVAGSAGANGLGGLRETGDDFAVARFLLDDANEIGGRIEGGVLKITGTPAADTIRVRIRGGELSVAGMAHAYKTTTFSRIIITALAGDDRIDASAATVPVMVDGGDGDDVVLGGSADDSLVGGAGHDTLFGGRGHDTLRGGDGRDFLNGGPGADAVFGDAGNDQVFALDGAIDTIMGGGGFDRVKGDAADVLTDVECVLG